MNHNFFRNRLPKAVQELAAIPLAKQRAASAFLLAMPLGIWGVFAPMQQSPQTTQPIVTPSPKTALNGETGNDFCAIDNAAFAPGFAR